jgi:chitin disaccharide deacetylase
VPRVGDVKLVVQADDLGMCRAVNAGIEAAATDGILTQTSVMAPTPWFAEGAAMARRLGLATGLHCTFTCEWDNLRWAPLSAGATLRLDDGTQPRTVEDAAARIEPGEALEELRVQARRATASGLELRYVDPHMGLSVTSAYPAICAELGLRFVYRPVDPHHRFDSLHYLSLSSTDDLSQRTGRFVTWLEQLGPGTHFVLSHPAVASEELRAICAPGADNADWAEPYRAADLDALTSPDVRRTIEHRGIELVALGP